MVCASSYCRRVDRFGDGLCARLARGLARLDRTRSRTGHAAPSERPWLRRARTCRERRIRRPRLLQCSVGNKRAASGQPCCSRSCAIACRWLAANLGTPAHGQPEERRAGRIRRPCSSAQLADHRRAPSGRRARLACRTSERRGLWRCEPRASAAFCALWRRTVRAATSRALVASRRCGQRSSCCCCWRRSSCWSTCGPGGPCWGQPAEARHALLRADQQWAAVSFRNKSCLRRNYRTGVNTLHGC